MRAGDIYSYTPTTMRHREGTAIAVRGLTFGELRLLDVFWAEHSSFGHDVSVGFLKSAHELNEAERATLKLRFNVHDYIPLPELDDANRYHPDDVLAVGAAGRGREYLFLRYRAKPKDQQTGSEGRGLAPCPQGETESAERLMLERDQLRDENRAALVALVHLTSELRGKPPTTLSDALERVETLVCRLRARSNKAETLLYAATSAAGVPIRRDEWMAARLLEEGAWPAEVARELNTPDAGTIGAYAARVSRAYRALGVKERIPLSELLKSPGSPA